jgi:hypothetical protein
MSSYLWDITLANIQFAPPNTKSQVSSQAIFAGGGAILHTPLQTTKCSPWQINPVQNSQVSRQEVPFGSIYRRGLLLA